MADGQNIQAVRYLLETGSVDELQSCVDDALQLGNVNAKALLDCSPKLINAETWQEFNKETRAEIEKLSKFPVDKEQQDQREERLKQLEQQIKAIDAINAAMQNADALLRLVLEDELEKYSPEFAKLTNEADKKAFKIRALESESIDLSLRETAARIIKLEKKLQADLPTYDFDAATDSLAVMVGAGNSTEEFVTLAQTRVDDLDGLQEQADPTATAASQTFNSLPLVGEFLRGMIYLRDAYRAFADKNAPQRKTRIGVGIFGGAVTLGSFIVGTLLLGSVGLLSAAAAVAIAPIAIAALAFGVCATALYRDSYILHQARRQEASIENKLNEITALENKTKNEIKAELGIPDSDNRLNSKLSEAFQRDPRLTRLSIDKANLNTALGKLNEAHYVAKRNVKLGTASFIAFGLALAAVCTGVGAIAIGAVATGIFLTLTSIRAYHIIKAVIQTREQKRLIKADITAIAEAQDDQIKARRTLKRMSETEAHVKTLLEKQKQNQPQDSANNIIADHYDKVAEPISEAPKLAATTQAPAAAAPDEPVVDEPQNHRGPQV